MLNAKFFKFEAPKTIILFHTINFPAVLFIKRTYTILSRLDKIISLKKCQHYRAMRDQHLKRERQMLRYLKTESKKCEDDIFFIGVTAPCLK